MAIGTPVLKGVLILTRLARAACWVMGSPQKSQTQRHPHIECCNFITSYLWNTNFQQFIRPIATTMVLTAAQTTAFFENNDQMGIPHATVIQLQQEGIDTIDDSADFDKDSLVQLAANL